MPTEAKIIICMWVVFCLSLFVAEAKGFHITAVYWFSVFFSFVTGVGFVLGALAWVLHA